MIPKFPRIEQPYRVFWCWDISYVCNYKCSYCIVDTWRKTTYLTPEEWKKIWDLIFENYGSTHIRFSGGEPFVYPNFLKLLRLLGEKHTLNITTNLSFDVEEFVKEVGSIADKAQLVISASFHPEFVSLKDFIGKICYLKSKGIYASVSFVSWPPFLKDMLAIKEEMEKNKIEFLIIPLQGAHFGKKYPEGYLPEERKFLEELSVLTSNPASKDMADFKLKEENKALDKRLCHMGQNFGMIRPNGNVYRCCTFEKAAYLGNLIEDSFKLLDGPEWCEITPCNCYKAMLAGEEQRYLSQWNWAKHKEGTYYTPNDKSKAEINSELKQVKNMANKYFTEGKIAEGIKVMEDMLMKYPEHILPYCFLGEVYIRTREFERAKTLLEKALSIASFESSVNRLCGYLYTEMRDFQKAFEYLNKAVDCPSDPADKGYTYFHIGRVYMKQGNIEKALESMRKAADMNPDDETIKETLKDLDE